MRLSLRYRLLLPLTLLLLGDVAATAWAAVTAANRAEQRLAAQLWGIARTLTSERSTFPLTKPILEQMRGLSGAEFLFHPPASRPGALPESSFDVAPAPPADVPLVAPSPDGEDHTLGTPVTISGTEYQCLRIRVVHRSPPWAGGELYIFYPESLRQTAVRDAVRPLLFLGGGGGLVAVVLAFAIGSRLVRRVRDLDARTRLIAAGDFRPMPVPASNDELRDLCEAVNDMARRLASFQEQLQRDERLRVLGQFSGGLAHQLRNAAAGAKLAVELFLAENPAADPEPLQVALRQLARIESNLRQFLALGKPPDAVRRPCDLVQLVDQVVSFLKPQCQHARTTLTWKPPAEPCATTGDPTQLSHLLGNVIGNAVEAAGADGTVEIDARVANGRVVIEVSDSGSGPSPEVAERLFEPFVTGKDQGIGLGLAVAKQAADAHGGRISWERRSGRTVFRIELPFADSHPVGL